MFFIILLYILISHKAGLGVEWYDWLLLVGVLLLNMIQVGSLVRSQQGMLDSITKLKGTKQSYFSDLFSKEKDEEE